MASTEKLAGIGSEAVKKATGKTWEQWLAILDKKKAMEIIHKDIASLLREKHALPQWWSQMITVGYEQARGLRKVNQQSKGFQISKSKTVPVSAARAFSAWNEKSARDQWLNEKIIIRKGTSGKSMRITWPDDSSVEVNFYRKESRKCQVVVQHTKLPNSTKAERMKKYWAEKLEAYKDFLGS